ncbi:MAG: hypothetical protein NTY38_04855 [Acidobacteria bacterium]|nr:hypothetical protein [Acidobacteriota bacterium]
MAGGLSAIIMLVQRRKHKDPWSGTVVSIQRHSSADADGDGCDFITVRYRRDDGQDCSFEVNASSYPFWYADLRPGDRLVKPAGEQIARRLDPAGNVR